MNIMLRVSAYIAQNFLHIMAHISFHIAHIFSSFIGKSIGNGSSYYGNIKMEYGFCRAIRVGFFVSVRG